MNLPNAITVGRIAVTPLIALLPLIDSWPLRLVAFWLFIVAAVSDYVDGHLARSRSLITNLGKILDPLADKLLLLGTFVPMFWLVGSGASLSLMSRHVVPLAAGAPGAMLREGTLDAQAFPFLTPFGNVGLPWWVLAVVLGRELFMTVFRQVAAKRGVYIAAIGPAKWKTGFQLTWVGATYFWFFAATLITHHGWTSHWARWFAWFNAFVGIVTMVPAVALTVWSLWLYMRRYGGLLLGRPTTAA